MLRTLLTYAKNDDSVEKLVAGFARVASARVRVGQPAAVPARVAARLGSGAARADRRRRRPRRARSRRGPEGVSRAAAGAVLSRRAACATSRISRRRRTSSGLRIAALDALLDDRAAVLVTSAVALAEKVPDPDLRPHGFEIEKGGLLDLEETADQLVDCGYERVDQVEERGQFAIRGDILDVYPATEERAVRCELFDVEVERLTWFSTFTQRSLEEAERVEIAPAAELAPEHRELAEIAAETEESERPDVAEVLPVDRFRELLDLVPDDARRGDRRRGGARAGPARLLGGRDHELPRRRRASPVREARGARRRARPRARASACRASPRTSRTSSAPSRPTPPRARCATPSRSSRSSSAPATAPSWRGRAAARPSAPSSTWPGCRPAFLDGKPAPEDPSLMFAHASLRDGFIAPQLKLAVLPEHRLLRRRRAERPAGPGRDRLVHGPPRRARRWCTRTTASPSSPASRRRPSAA